MKWSLIVFQILEENNFVLTAASWFLCFALSFSYIIYNPPFPHLPSISFNCQFYCNFSLLPICPKLLICLPNKLSPKGFSLPQNYIHAVFWILTFWILKFFCILYEYTKIHFLPHREQSVLALETGIYLRMLHKEIVFVCCRNCTNHCRAKTRNF